MADRHENDRERYGNRGTERDRERDWRQEGLGGERQGRGDWGNEGQESGRRRSEWGREGGYDRPFAGQGQWNGPEREGDRGWNAGGRFESGRDDYFSERGRTGRQEWGNEGRFAGNEGRLGEGRQWGNQGRGGEGNRGEGDRGIWGSQGSSGAGQYGQGGGSYGGYGAGGSYTGGMGSYGQTGRYSGRGPKGYQRADERIREDVCEHLTQHPEVDAAEIEVQVKAGEVTLTGNVERREMKRMAEEAAERVAGVKDVHNQIRVHQGAFAGGGQGQSGQGSSGQGQSGQTRSGQQNRSA